MQDCPKLEEALREFRATASIPERLSATARSRILGLDSRRRGGPRAFRSLFPPLGRLALATGLPAVMLALMLGYLALPQPGPSPAGNDRPVELRVSRSGDEVVFEIANGGQPHRVYRSTEEEGPQGGDLFTVARGSFRDRLDSEGDLVFYRVE